MINDEQKPEPPAILQYSYAEMFLALLLHFRQDKSAVCCISNFNILFAILMFNILLAILMFNILLAILMFNIRLAILMKSL